MLLDVLLGGEDAPSSPAAPPRQQSVSTSVWTADGRLEATSAGRDGPRVGGPPQSGSPRQRAALQAHSHHAVQFRT